MAVDQETKGLSDSKTNAEDDETTKDTFLKEKIIKNENNNDVNEGAIASDPNLEERFRVDRKKLESLLQDEQHADASNGFFHRIEDATNTTISWPAKLKIGAKSRKDPYIKVAGLPEDRLVAKQMVLSVMDTKSTRVTLKMDVSFADHSHIIGKGGNTIKKVMKDTQCHIHFPDSNRTSSEKSNQVSIAGPPFCVESARRQIRELLPIVLKFEIPSTSVLIVPDSSSPVITNIAQCYNVTISFQQQLRAYGYIGSVRGLHSDPFSVRGAILKVLEHLTGTVPVTVPVTTQLEIDPKHHIYVIGRNGCNIKKISQSTGASIHFPDPHDPTTRPSTITVTGSIESAVTAKVFLLEYLPLILMFDVRDGESSSRLEEGMLEQLMDSLDIQINVKSKPRQFCKSIIVKGYEKNASNIYKSRLHIIGEDPSNMPFLLSPLATLGIPPPTGLPLHILSNSMVPTQVHRNNPTSISPMSPPVQSSSPLVGQPPLVSSNRTPYINVSHHGQRIIGSEVKMKRLSIDALLGSVEGDSDDIDGPKGNLSGDGLSSSRSTESILDALRNKDQPNEILEPLALSDSWRPEPNVMKPTCTSSGGSVDSGLSRSQEELAENLSMTTNMLKGLQMPPTSKYNTEDYEQRKQLAKAVMQSQVAYGKARTPTDAWSGLGFSNSMPASKIKELWNVRDKRMAGKQMLNGIQQSPDASLNSSASSNESSSNQMAVSPNKLVCRPPPGLEDSQPSIDNMLLLSNNNDYASVLPIQDPIGSPQNMYLGLKCISDLFRKLNLEQYIEAFEKEEVDLSTFMSLTDDDLKELGVATFGARKKMANAMKELQTYNNPSMHHTSVPASTTGFYRHLDVAAHSLRW